MPLLALVAVHLPLIAVVYPESMPLSTLLRLTLLLALEAGCPIQGVCAADDMGGKSQTTLTPSLVVAGSPELIRITALTATSPPPTGTECPVRVPYAGHLTSTCQRPSLAAAAGAAGALRA